MSVLRASVWMDAHASIMHDIIWVIFVQEVSIFFFSLMRNDTFHPSCVRIIATVDFIVMINDISRTRLN